MLSFQTMYTQAQEEVSDEDSTVLTFLKRNINIGLHLLEAELGSFYTEETWSDTTVAGTFSYQAPDRFVRAKALYVTVGTRQYPVSQVFDESLWRQLQSSGNSVSNNIPQYYFVRRDTYELYPLPSENGNVITMIYESSNKDLSADDYTTGTITTLANGGVAVTGSSTAFTSAMIGRFLKINDYPIWYEISAVGSSTGLTLKKKYQGTSISAGTSAFTIGEFSRTPPSTHIIPVHYAIAQYYGGPKKDRVAAADFTDKYMGQGKYEGMGLKAAKATYGRRYSSKVIPNQKLIRMGTSIMNPNMFPQPLT